WLNCNLIHHDARGRANRLQNFDRPRKGPYKARTVGHWWTLVNQYMPTNVRKGLKTGHILQERLAASLFDTQRFTSSHHIHVAYPAKLATALINLKERVARPLENSGLSSEQTSSGLAQALSQAIFAFQTNNFAEAYRLCDIIVQQDQGNVVALHL